MKKLIFLVLAVLLTLSLAACTPAAPTESTNPGTTVPETTDSATVPSNPSSVGGSVNYFSLDLSEDQENMRYIIAYPNEDGSVYVEYMGDVKKVGNLDADTFDAITAALAESGLAALNGQEVSGEGEASGTMNITYADETMLSCSFSGEIPQEFRDAYAVMDDFFATLTASIPEYVPQPFVDGEVEQTLLAELNGIISGAGIANPDSYVISAVAKDEYFAYSLGLGSDTGVADAALCAPMMMTTAYSLAVVKLEEGADANAVCADFAANVDWQKWVCVMPSDALVATKDNMVLCLVADGDLYTQTSSGIENAGWTVVETLENPAV